MPNVYKSMPVEVLDGFFDNGPDLADNLRFSLGLLEGNQSLKTITEGLGSEHPEFGNVSEQADDFEDFWLEPLSNQGVERVMRRAYRHAVKLAAEGVNPEETNLTEQQPSQPKPIETFWITGAGSEFEMHVCKTDLQRIAVFVITPLTPDPPGSANAHSQSWSFRAGPNDSVVIEQVSGEISPPED